MEYERKAVTITWKIENVEYIVPELKIDLYSSVISVDVMDGTQWKLGIRGLFKSTILLTLRRAEKDNGPYEFGIHYTFAVGESHETSSTRRNTFSFLFHRGQKCPSVLVDLPESSESLSSRFIFIQCKIWRQTGSISKSEDFFALTRIGEEKFKFRAKFSILSNTSADKASRNMVVTWTKETSTGEKVMQIKLVLYRRYNLKKELFNEIKMEIIPLDYHFQRICNIKIYILDSTDKKKYIKNYEKQITLKSHIKISEPVVSNEFLKENPDLYSANDSMLLLCKITVSPEVSYEEAQKIEDEQDSTSEIKNTKFANSVELLTSKDGIDYDTNLQTTTEIFPVHAAILSAHSPIFKEMFKTNTGDGIQKCLHVGDVDNEIVKHMLVFLYSENLEELEWKDAMKLFIASEKYQILTLKEKCASILKQGINLSNCCVLFYLGDLHHDIDLQRFAQNYIAKYDKAVIFSDQWKELAKNHPQLAIYYFRDQYLERILFKL